MPPDFSDCLDAAYERLALRQGHRFTPVFPINRNYSAESRWLTRLPTKEEIRDNPFPDHPIYEIQYHEDTLPNKGK